MSSSNLKCHLGSCDCCNVDFVCSKGLFLVAIVAVLVELLILIMLGSLLFKILPRMKSPSGRY